MQRPAENYSFICSEPNQCSIERVAVVAWPVISRVLVHPLDLGGTVGSKDKILFF